MHFNVKFIEAPKERYWEEHNLISSPGKKSSKRQAVQFIGKSIILIRVQVSSFQKKQVVQIETFRS